MDTKTRGSGTMNIGKVLLRMKLLLQIGKLKLVLSKQRNRFIWTLAREAYERGV